MSDSTEQKNKEEDPVKKNWRFTCELCGEKFPDILRGFDHILLAHPGKMKFNK